jgi:predicted kinase
MPTLIITRGLPGCGARELAATWVAQDYETRVAISYRRMAISLYGMDRNFPRALEKAVRDAQHIQVREFLLKGYSVIVPDPNLVLKEARAFADIAQRTGAEFQVRDLTDVPVGECVERDSKRLLPVGEAVIRDLNRRYKFPLPKVEPTPRRAGERPPWYVPSDPKTIPAVIVDLDGTLAINVTGREVYGEGFEEHVYEDEVNENVLRFIDGWLMQGHDLIFMSGRAEAARSETERWLADKASILDHEYELFMRADGDHRYDYEVKADLFEEHVRPHHSNVALAIDDRNQIVDLWRGIGIPCWQVRDGDF